MREGSREGCGGLWDCYNVARHKVRVWCIPGSVVISVYNGFYQAGFVQAIK